MNSVGRILEVSPGGVASRAAHGAAETASGRWVRPMGQEGTGGAAMPYKPSSPYNHAIAIHA